MNRQADLPDEVRALVDQFGIIDSITQKLFSMQESEPTLNKFIVFSTYDAVQYLEDIIPSEGRKLMGKAPWNYEFHRGLANAPGIFLASTSHYPALFKKEKSHTQCVMTMEFLHHFFPIIQDNANAVKELESLLKTKSEKPWFSSLPVPKPDEEAWEQAIMNSLKVLVEKNPRKFPEIVRESMHAIGFDNSRIKSKDVMAVLDKTLRLK
jgi:hypothetical protein